MGPPKGNQNAKKLKTTSIKLIAYESYCKWIAKGEEKAAWVFEHKGTTLTWETMEKYIRNEPLVFHAHNKRAAEAHGYQHWLELGKKMMLGEIEGKVQPAIYQMFMRNKFAWDKEGRDSATVKEAAMEEFKNLREQAKPLLQEAKQEGNYG